MTFGDLTQLTTLGLCDNQLAALERSCARKAELSREGAAAAAKQEARLREAREQVAKAEPNLLALHAKRVLHLTDAETKNLMKVVPKAGKPLQRLNMR